MRTRPWPSGSARHTLESCTLQLQSWSPFKPQPLDLDPLKPSSYKRHCRSDRSTADLLLGDLSSLSLADEPPPPPTRKPRGLPLIAHRKRRRHAVSRSVSGRSSDRSGTRRRCCSVGGSYATCSDFPGVAAGGTDSSGELFANGGEVSWGSDVSGEARPPMTAGKEVGMDRERDGLPVLLGGGGFAGALLMEQQQQQQLQGSEPCGYGSETGYKGDAEEFGYEDEVDEEDDDGKPLFWRDRFDEDAFPEMKSHPRCRRKRQDSKIIAYVKE